MRRAVRMPAAVFAAAFLSDTLNWLNLWHGNEAAGGDLAGNSTRPGRIIYRRISSLARAVAWPKPPNRTPTTPLPGNGSADKFGPWIKIGSGRLNQDGAEIVLRVLPIGGFSGYVRLIPNGKAPPLPEPEPQRPGEIDGDAENFLG